MCVCVCNLSVVSFVDSCICSDIWSVLLISVRTNSGRNFYRSARIDGQITSTTARKAAAIGTCGILIVSYCFLLISFDVQDVVIDVHDFRVCSKTDKNQWKLKGFIDYNGVVATETTTNGK